VLVPVLRCLVVFNGRIQREVVRFEVALVPRLHLLQRGVVVPVCERWRIRFVGGAARDAVPLVFSGSELDLLRHSSASDTGRVADTEQCCPKVRRE